MLEEKDVALAQRRLLRSLGRTIRHVRRERDMTQEALGEGANLNPKHISELERGRVNPTIISLTKLASTLRTHVADLLFACEKPSGEDHFFHLQMMNIVRKLSRHQIRKLIQIATLLAEE